MKSSEKPAMNKKDEDLRAFEAKLLELEIKMWLATEKPVQWLYLLYGWIGSWAIIFVFLVGLLVWTIK